MKKTQSYFFLIRSFSSFLTVSPLTMTRNLLPNIFPKQRQLSTKRRGRERGKKRSRRYGRRKRGGWSSIELKEENQWIWMKVCYVSLRFAPFLPSILFIFVIIASSFSFGAFLTPLQSDEIPSGLLETPKMMRGQLKDYQRKGLTWLVNLYEQGAFLLSLSCLLFPEGCRDKWNPC